MSPAHIASPARSPVRLGRYAPRPAYNGPRRPGAAGRGPRSGGVPMPDPLLLTKIRVPPPRPGLLPRDRLRARLDEGMARGLVVVAASAGAGKTSAVADWARAAQIPLAWVSLEPDEADPARFLAYLLAAIRGARPGVAETAAALLDGGRDLSPSEVLVALVNDLAAEGEPLVVVLDDLHRASSPEVDAILRELVEHRPAELALVLTGRSDPPLPLARLRLEGALVELRDADLRFAEDEARALLEQVAERALAAEDAAALASRTEGWAAGLQAAGLSLRGRPEGEIDDLVADFGGEHRYVLDYLAEEVLARQPEEVRAFLRDTAVLDRLDVPSCAALTGAAQEEILAMLARLERENLFLLPLDAERSGYRYHQLFGDLLRHRLSRRDPERLARQHRRAARHRAAAGETGAAVRHALAAGERALAADLVAAEARGLVARRELRRLARWLDALPREEIRARPRLCLARAWQAMLARTRRSEVEAWLLRAERALGEGGPAAAAGGPDDEARERAEAALLRAEIAVLRARLASWEGDVAASVALAEEALAALGGREDAMVELAALEARASALHMRGEPDEASRAFGVLVHRARELEAPLTELLALASLARSRKMAGRLRAAAEAAEQAVALAEDPAWGGAAPPGSASALFALGAVRTAQLRFDEAERRIREGLALARRAGRGDQRVVGLIALSVMARSRDDLEAARAHYDEALGLVAGTDLSLVGAYFALDRAQLDLSAGDLASASAWAADWRRLCAGDGEPADPDALLRQSGDALLAEVMAARGEVAAARDLVAETRRRAERAGRGEIVVRLLAREAALLARLGEETTARGLLEEALARGADEGYVLPFLQPAEEALPPLHALSTDAGPGAERARRVLARARATGLLADDGPTALPAATTRATATARDEPARVDPLGRGVLVEPLTEREAEVLALLAEGCSNREIAEDLVIVVGTVKRHLSNLYDKLEARSRTRAVARARELGLLP